MEYLHHASLGIGALGVLVIALGVASGLARFVRSEIRAVRGVETKPEWIQAAGEPSATPRPPESLSLGTQTLVGEIVDSKCFLGVMNPGQLTPHRACAIRCISGGVPPVLLVRQKDGPSIYLLLVSADGQPVTPPVLEMGAEPVAITGEVERQGELLILRADPARYRKL